MAEELLEIRYGSKPQTVARGPDEQVVSRSTTKIHDDRYHLIIEDGVEYVPLLKLLLIEVKVFHDDIEKITMANTVKTLRDNAFGMFTNLEEMIWSKNLETI